MRLPALLLVLIETMFGLLVVGLFGVCMFELLALIYFERQRQKERKRERERGLIVSIYFKRERRALGLLVLVYQNQIKDTYVAF